MVVRSGRRGRLVEWVRAIPRGSVLGFCAVLLAAGQGIFAPLEVRMWIRVVTALLVLAIAVASEADKLNTKRVEKAADDAREAGQAEAREREWQRRVEGALRWWPCPLLPQVDPYELGVRRSSTARR